jgi:putative CocE/NonD family hydrolase
MTRAAALALALVALIPATAAGQAVPPDCGGGTTGGQPSRVTQKGPFAIGETGVVELDSAVDGKKIQVAYVRPAAPAGYRSPVIVEAGSYFEADLKDVDPTTCSDFLVQNYVQHGYTVAFVPSRGAGGTDSCADLFGAKEVADLSQAITWLGSQPWSNGNVGMTGLSYHGSTPWDVASTGNPHLKTIVPGSGVHSLWDLVFYRGRNDWRWWFFVPGYYDYYGLAFSNPATGRDPDRYAAAANCDTHTPGMQASVESYETGEYDSLGYFAERDHDQAILEKYRGSVMVVQGLQDFNVDPAHQYPFVNQLEDRGVYVKHLLGQWNHAWPDGDVGARGDYADILLRWWDRWLKEDHSVKTGPRAEVQDSDLKWRAEDAWPPKQTTSRTLYLSADKTLSEQPKAEKATATLGPGSRNRYVFLSGAGEDYNDLPIDHACALCATFTYDVKGGDLRLVGFPTLSLKLVPRGSAGHVSAYAFRVDADGAWHFLGWGASDLRFPHGETKAQPVTAGTPIDMDLPLQPLDAVVHAGEQIMLVLDQGNADHMPGVPFFPVDLEYGAGQGVLRFEQGSPKADAFFTPPAP